MIKIPRSVLKTAWVLAAAAIGLSSAVKTAHADTATYVGWSQAEVGLKPPLTKMLTDFQAAHAADKVEVIGFPFGQMEQNLELRRRNNQRMDVAQLQERWLPPLVKMNTLYDLNKVFGADYLAARFEPEVLKLGQVDGKQAGLPFTLGAITLVGNRKVLDAAGVTTMPRTLAEFTAALRKIRASNKDVIPFGFSTRSTPVIEVESMIMFWAHGARVIDDAGKVVVDSPEARMALQFLADGVKDGLIVKGNDRFDTRKLFAADKVAFFLDPPTVRGFVRAQSVGPDPDAKVMVLSVPTAKAGDTPRPLLWAHYLVMYNMGGTTGRADSLGAKMMAAMGMDNDSQMALWREAGQLPTLKTALTEVRKDPYAQAFVDAAKTARWDDTAKYGNGAELRQIIGEEVEAGMLGAKSVDEAIRSMARRLTTAMKDAQ